MGTFVFHLPRELCKQIIDQLDRIDLVCLSAVSKLCHEQLVPVIFTTISFSNEPRSCASAMVAAEKYGHYTNRIEFHYRATGESVEVTIGRELRATLHDIIDGASSRLRGPILRPDAHSLLKGHRMPNLQSLEVIFNMPQNFITWQAGRLFSYRWRWSDMLVNWRQYSWLILLNEVYAAISNNLSISELVLAGMIPCHVDAFSSRRFHNFLSRLKSISIRFMDIFYCLPDTWYCLKAYLNFSSTTCMQSFFLT